MPVELEKCAIAPSMLAWRYGFFRYISRGGRQIERFLQEALLP